MVCWIHSLVHSHYCLYFHAFTIEMYLFTDFGLGGQGGQGGASDGQQAGFGRDFGGGQSGTIQMSQIINLKLK